MRTQSLKIKILSTLFISILIFSVAVLFLGTRIIKNDIIARAQNQVKNDLFIAHSVYYGEIEAIKAAFNLAPLAVDLNKVKQSLGLDYLYVVEDKDKDKVRSEIVLGAFKGQPTGANRIIGKEELLEMSQDIYRKAEIEIRPTPKSHPNTQKVLDKAMAIGYAMPVFDGQGKVKQVIYGGKILNRDFALVDKIRNLVFEDKFYNGKPLGTVTIFLDDIRIATNVLDNRGQRAIGTVVSDRVYKKVVEDAKMWLDRAFVVTDWYLTAYEPIKNIKGEIIGILYVGLLEKPFKDMEKRIFLGFLAIVSLVAVLAAISSYILAYSISQPVTGMLEATDRISSGQLDYRLKSQVNIKELNYLAEAFNIMASKLKERQESYLDLISFVAHELKGILSSTILNAYSVRDGFLGMINFKQTKAMDSVARNLDYLDATVKNFLNLSRIEKGHLELNKVDLLIKEDVFDPAVDAFSKQAADKHIFIVNNIEPGLKIEADLNLFQVVANNLMGNAIKYGLSGGKIILSSKAAGKDIDIEIYNDGRPLSVSEQDKLFKKFSRLNSEFGKKIQGTGLGLFITREIVNQHGWQIRVEPSDKGNTFKLKLTGEN
ncbi:MAG: cache domain-containing protein [Candidatus Omnitrophica bacterium]|nr:cache domain-containing protein [Candidatus Omnitrophota bacterium]